MVEPKKPLVGDVLIIDDDKGISEILEAYCKNMGCFRFIIHAQDGLVASSKMRNQKFALILMDLKLPKKSGLDLIRELDDKSINKKNSIVIVSGAIDKTILEKCVALGIKNFVPKPFEESVFQEKVLKILASK